jgi:type IV secretion system protein VirB9
MIRKVSFAALAVLGCTSAADADNRIRSLAYDPDHIVQILGKAGIQSTIEFAADERIENVAVGDSNAWQITPNRRASLLFVKPLTPRSRTNMTVVTDRRTYMFDLVAGDKWTTPVYALKFSYPNDKPAEAEMKPGQTVSQIAAAASQPPAAMADKLHFDWQSKGYGKLIPSRVFDDGAAIYLSWNRETPLPAILTISEDRKEGPLTYRMSGEYIVISPIPQNLVLRYGNRMAVLWTTRRIAPAAPAASPPSDLAQRMAAVAVSPTPAPAMQQPHPVQAAPAQTQSGPVKLANLTTLYSDKLTDGRQ